MPCDGLCDGRIHIEVVFICYTHYPENEENDLEIKRETYLFCLPPFPIDVGNYLEGARVQGEERIPLGHVGVESIPYVFAHLNPAENLVDIRANMAMPHRIAVAWITHCMNGAFEKMGGEYPPPALGGVNEETFLHASRFSSELLDDAHDDSRMGEQPPEFDYRLQFDYDNDARI